MQTESAKGNIGEWSELYTLGYLLLNGGAFAADEMQNSIQQLFHKVLDVRISDTSSENELQYHIKHSAVSILIAGEEVAKVEKSLIEAHLKSLLFDLQSGRNRGTFSLDSGSALLSSLRKNRISASSWNMETDLDLSLEDPVTGSPTPWVGFSVKSQLGGRSTLLNASGATNFVFKVVKNENSHFSEYPKFEHGQHRKNLERLYSAGFKLEFESMANQVFYTNLTLLDLQFPRLLADALVSSYLSGVNSFSEVIHQIFPPSDDNSRQPIFKFKEFLGAIAMGLRPSTQWDGDTTKFKGILVVKQSGEVVFYYLYNRKNFEEYLFRNVSFERASTSRHNYGTIYAEEGIDKIKLNLQIRFNA